MLKGLITSFLNGKKVLHLIPISHISRSQKEQKFADLKNNRRTEKELSTSLTPLPLSQKDTENCIAQLFLAF